MNIIKANNRSYKIEYSYNAFCDIEKESGVKSIDELFPADAKDFSLNKTRILLWGGLIEHQPEITLHEAGLILGDVLKKGTLSELTEALGVAVKEALPDPGKSRPTKGK